MNSIMGFYKPTEGNPLRISVGEETMSVQSCHLLPDAPAQCKGPGVLHTNAEANCTASEGGTGGACPEPCLGLQPQTSAERSWLPRWPCHQGGTSGQEDGQGLLPDAVTFPSMWSLPPLPNPSSDEKAWPPMRLRLIAPKYTWRKCLKLSP